MPHKDLADRNACQKRCHDRNPNRLAEMRKANRKVYRIRAEIIKTAKDRPCMDCSRNFPSCCMDFDHRPNTIKLFTIGEWGYKRSIEALTQEIAKCDVVCANCHRIRTFLRRDES